MGTAVGTVPRRAGRALALASIALVVLACSDDRLRESARDDPTPTATATSRASTPTARPPLTADLDPDDLPREITAFVLRHVTYEPSHTENGEGGEGDDDSDDGNGAATGGGSDSPSVIAELGQASDEDGLRTTTETARLGEYAGESILRPEDPEYRNDLGYRAEWQSEFYAEQDVEYWYSASFYLPEDWDQGRNRTFDDRIIFQFHEGRGSPVFSLHIHEESERFFVRHKRADESFEYLWSRPFEVGRWYDFAFHVKWTRDDDGFFRIYLNQHLVREYQGRTLAEGRTVYTKWGIYGQPTHVIYDEVRIIQGPAALRLATPWPAVRF